MPSICNCTNCSLASVDEWRIVRHLLRSDWPAKQWSETTVINIYVLFNSSIFAQCYDSCEVGNFYKSFLAGGDHQLWWYWNGFHFPYLLAFWNAAFVCTFVFSTRIVQDSMFLPVVNKLRCVICVCFRDCYLFSRWCSCKKFLEIYFPELI